MPFHYVLTNLLVDVPEAIGAIFLDAEGEAIEWVSQSSNEPYQLRIEGAYQAVVKRQIDRAVSTHGAGILQSYVIVGSHLATLTEMLPHGYYVVLVARRTGSLGHARFHLRKAAGVLASEV
jgi:predicted regulator of Ras-like GTPase activity (Roadblock/LC7/MglB family)